jgi:hypothetical protein
VRPQVAHDVAGDQAALLGIGEDHAQAAPDLLDHRRRSRVVLALPQLVLEIADHRRAQLGQPHAAKIGRDVHVEVAPVFIDGRALQAILLGGSNPLLARLGHCDALAVCGVRAVADVHRDRRVMGVGLFLLAERFDVAFALLVDVVDDPRFLGAVSVRPGPLAN